MNEQQAADDWSLARTIGRLAPHLPDDMRDHVIGIARGLKTGGARLLALGCLAAALPDPIAAQLTIDAMAGAEVIEDQWSRGFALAFTAQNVPHLMQQASKMCLSTLATLPNERQRAQLLRMVAGLLPDDLVSDALLEARAIQDAPSRTRCLVSLAKHLSIEERSLLLDALQGIDNEETRLYALVSLAEHLPPQCMPQVLQEVRAHSEPADRAWALTMLLKYFPDGQAELASEVIALVCGLANPYFQSGLLVELSAAYPQAQLAGIVEEQLSMARECEDLVSQADILGTLARCLPQSEREAVLGEAFNAAKSIDDPGLRGEELASLLGALPEDLRPQAIRETLEAIHQVIGSNAS